jgi:hypothetical protein
MANKHNTMQDPSRDVCSICSEPVVGGYTVRASEAADAGPFAIEIVGTPDRDFNDCDVCNTRVHFRCSKHPETGYCDPCFLKYGSRDSSIPESPAR